MKKNTLERLYFSVTQTIITMAQITFVIVVLGLVSQDTHWEYIFILIACLFLREFLINFIIESVNTVGSFMIDTSHEDRDIYRLELTTEPEVLATKKRITLIVDANADLSQEKRAL